MNNIFHEGEYHIQEKMGVRSDSDSLSSMIKTKIPVVAANFIKSLNFSVVSLNTNEKDTYTSLVYNINSFIQIIDDENIAINLEKCSFIPKHFFEGKSLNIGFIGLDFENKMRIRINGKGKIRNNILYVNTHEVYANCPKYIFKRRLKKEITHIGKSKITEFNELNEVSKNIISNANTFFLSSSNIKKGADVSHKGGKKGFIKILSPTRLEFEDKVGNNLYNSLGNIYTNPNVSLIFIDFKKHNTLHIKGKASIIENFKEKRKKLKIRIECTNISLNTNSFLLDYEDLL